MYTANEGPVRINHIFTLGPLSVIFLSSCHIPVCRSCGTLSYSLCFSHQTDQGDETEGL